MTEPELPPELMLRSVLKHDIEQTFLLLSYPENIRVLWRHVRDNKAEKAQLVTSVCADYTDGLLVTLELAFWMRQLVGHEWVPYNMQFRYEGNAAVLTSAPVDVGRFNSMRGLAPGQNALNATKAVNMYNELWLANSCYGIQLPGEFQDIDGRCIDVWIQVPRSLVLDRSRPRASDPFTPVR